MKLLHFTLALRLNILEIGSTQDQNDTNLFNLFLFEFEFELLNCFAFDCICFLSLLRKGCPSVSLKVNVYFAYSLQQGIFCINAKSLEGTTSKQQQPSVLRQVLSLQLAVLSHHRQSSLSGIKVCVHKVSNQIIGFLTLEKKKKNPIQDDVVNFIKLL